VRLRRELQPGNRCGKASGSKCIGTDAAICLPEYISMDKLLFDFDDFPEGTQ